MAEPWYIDTTSEGALKANVPYGDEFLPFQPTPAGETANIEELYDFDWAKFRRNQLAEQKRTAEHKRRQDEARTTIENRGKSDFYLEDGIPSVDTFEDIPPFADKRIRSLDEILEGGRERFPWSGAGKKLLEAGDVWARGVPETILNLGIGAADLALKGVVGFTAFTHPSTRPTSLEEFRTMFGQYPWRPDEGGTVGTVADVLPTIPQWEPQSKSGQEMVGAMQDIFHTFDERMARGLGDVVLKITGNPEAAAAAYATPHALLQALLMKGAFKGQTQINRGWDRIQGKPTSPHGEYFPAVDRFKQPPFDEGVGVDPLRRYGDFREPEWTYHGGEYPNVPMQRAEFVENLPNLVGAEFNNWAAELTSLLKGDWKYTNNIITDWMNQVMPEEVAAWQAEGTLDMRVNQVRTYLIDFVEMDVVPVIIDQVSAPLGAEGQSGAYTLRIPRDTPEHLETVAEQTPVWQGSSDTRLGEAMTYRPGGEPGTSTYAMSMDVARAHKNKTIERIMEEQGIPRDEAFDVFMTRMITGEDPFLMRPTGGPMVSHEPGVGRIGLMRIYEENMSRSLDIWPETIGYLVAHEGWHLMDGALADAFTRIYGQRGKNYTVEDIKSRDGKKITDEITKVLLKETEKIPSGFKKYTAREKIILDNIKNEYSTYAELVPSIRKLSFDMNLSANQATYTGGNVGKLMRRELDFEYLSEPTELMARMLETQLWLKSQNKTGNLDYLFMQSPGKVPHSVAEIINVFRDSYWKDRLHRPDEGAGLTYVPEDITLGEISDAQLDAIREGTRTARNPDLQNFDNTVVTLREAFDSVNPFSEKAGGNVFAGVRKEYNDFVREAKGSRASLEELPPSEAVRDFQNMMRRIFGDELGDLIPIENPEGGAAGIIERARGEIERGE